MLTLLPKNLAEIDGLTLPACSHTSAAPGMADSDPSQICPHEEIDKDSTSAEASMSGNNDTGNTIGESLADDSSSSQSFITEMSTSASTDLEDHTLESSTSGSTSRTDRGRNGKKWIGKNHKIIEKLKKDNGECLL